jgi:hypothetical protein
MPPLFYRENVERHAPWAVARKQANINAMERIEGDYELSPLPMKVFPRPCLILVGRQDSRVGFLEALETDRDVKVEHHATTATARKRSKADSRTTSRRRISSRFSRTARYWSSR